jgi:hypothetical protein
LKICEKKHDFKAPCSTEENQKAKLTAERTEIAEDAESAEVGAEKD